MKELFLLTVLSLAIILVGSRLAEVRQVREETDRYGISEQLNKAKTGNAVCFYLNYDNDWYLFIRDLKRNPSRPQFLCYMNYTSTQGSYRAKWSKDEHMIAVFNESSLRWSQMETWVVGYDWKQGRVLHSKEIIQQFKKHGGVGAEFIFSQLRTSTPEELKQFQPEKLNHERRMP